MPEVHRGRRDSLIFRPHVRFGKTPLEREAHTPQDSKMKRTDIVVSAKLTRPKQPVNSRSPKCFTGHYPRCAGDPNTTLGQNRLGMQPRLDNRQGKVAVSASKLIARYHATTPWHVRDRDLSSLSLRKSDSAINRSGTH